MKTIDEYNRKAEKSGVRTYNYPIQYRWVASGIMCPCGCHEELVSALPQPLTINHNMKERVMCGATGKHGYLLKDGSARGIITGMEWDRSLIGGPLDPNPTCKDCGTELCGSDMSWCTVCKKVKGKDSG